MSRRVSPWGCLLVAAAVLAGGGCRSMGLSPAALAGSAMAGLAEAISRQPDPELVRAGTPTLLLAVDSFLISSPDDPELLRTAASAYAAYVQAFLMGEESQTRAAALSARARDYGLRLLARQKGLADPTGLDQEGFEQALRGLGKRAVPDLYAAGAAWITWILARPDSMEALAELPKALALMGRVLELDEAHAAGGVHIVFGIHCASQLPGAGQDLAQGQRHFERAAELAGEGSLLPSVLMAEFCARAAGDEKRFAELLERVLSASGPAPAEQALSNALARERARYLLAHKAEYF